MVVWPPNMDGVNKECKYKVKQIIITSLTSRSDFRDKSVWDLNKRVTKGLYLTLWSQDTYGVRPNFTPCLREIDKSTMKKHSRSFSD